MQKTRAVPSAAVVLGFEVHVQFNGVKLTDGRLGTDPPQACVTSPEVESFALSCSATQNFVQRCSKPK